jgi:hypothetical protein
MPGILAGTTGENQKYAQGLFAHRGLEICGFSRRCSACALSLPVICPIHLTMCLLTLYYSDLDGTWDANNNSQFGEYDYTNL